MGRAGWLGQTRGRYTAPMIAGIELVSTFNGSFASIENELGLCSLSKLLRTPTLTRRIDSYPSALFHACIQQSFLFSGGRLS